MIEIDRTQLLRTLDQRHDDLVRQLDELNEQIEQALARSGDVAPETAPNRPAPNSARPAAAVSR